MPELHSNGSYDPYIAQLFNSLGGGARFNPAAFTAQPGENRDRRCVGDTRR